MMIFHNTFHKLSAILKTADQSAPLQFLYSYKDTLYVLISWSRLLEPFPSQFSSAQGERKLSKTCLEVRV